MRSSNGVCFFVLAITCFSTATAQQAAAQFAVQLEGLSPPERTGRQAIATQVLDLVASPPERSSPASAGVSTDRGSSEATSAPREVSADPLCSLGGFPGLRAGGRANGSSPATDFRAEFSNTFTLRGDQAAAVSDRSTDAATGEQQRRAVPKRANRFAQNLADIDISPPSTLTLSLIGGCCFLLWFAWHQRAGDRHRNVGNDPA